MRWLFCKAIVFLNVLLTAILWLYFTFGSLIFFYPLVPIIWIFTRKKDRAAQLIYYYFFRFFFILLRLFSAGIKIQIPEEVKEIKSCIVICNHRSYLDPLFLISLFKRNKTIVKGIFFKVPIFGWGLRLAGYTSFTDDSSTKSMIMAKRIQEIRTFLQDGGVFFIFPEGTRSRDGELGKFHKGAFNLAKMCRAPIAALRLTGTDLVFPPGQFSLNLLSRNRISIDTLKIINPDYEIPGFSTRDLANECRKIYIDRSK